MLPTSADQPRMRGIRSALLLSGRFVPMCWQRLDSITSLPASEPWLPSVPTASSEYRHVSSDVMPHRIALVEAVMSLVARSCSTCRTAALPS
jgi:hypothetical protein